MDCFKERTSGTASIMKSAFERSEMDVVGSRRERALSASTWLRRDLETSFSSSLSGRNSCQPKSGTCTKRIVMTGEFQAFVQRCL